MKIRVRASRVATARATDPRRARRDSLVEADIRAEVMKLKRWRSDVVAACAGLLILAALIYGAAGSYITIHSLRGGYDQYPDSPGPSVR